jgi:hypothetical protein
VRGVPLRRGRDNTVARANDGTALHFGQTSP